MYSTAGKVGGTAEVLEEMRDNLRNYRIGCSAWAMDEVGRGAAYAADPVLCTKSLRPDLLLRVPTRPLYKLRNKCCHIYVDVLPGRRRLRALVTRGIVIINAAI